ncbi:hypothetical protein [Dactylosporangium sp. NPDC048998]|uniref:hypothetical protein n=1 Tax=Dactylosporangium sp. NPDC048998 TaxID=3363976 RepID=UPI003712A267
MARKRHRRDHPEQPVRPAPPPPWAYFLLAALPPAAGLAGIRALWLSNDVDDGWWWMVGGLLVGLAAGGLAMWSAENRQTLVTWSVPVLGAASAAFGVPGRHGQLLSDSEALPVAAAVAGGSLAFFVGALLWLTGRLDRGGHRVTVWLLCSSTADPDGYRAICDCSWKSERFADVAGEDAEERAFAAARGHSPKVSRFVQVRP